MKIDNRTAYDTRALRSILCAVHALDATSRGGAKNASSNGRLATWDRLVVVVRHGRRGDRPFTGHAFYHGRRATLSIPRESCDVRALVALWQHELWHLYSIRHADMPPSVLWCRADSPFVERVVASLAPSLGGGLDPVALIEVPVEPVVEDKPDVRVERVARLVERRIAWATKARRASTALGKIDRALKRYAAAGLDVPVDALEAPAMAARPKKRRRPRQRTP